MIPAALKEPMLNHGFTQHENQNDQHPDKERLSKSNEELLNCNPPSFLLPSIRRIQVRGHPSRLPANKLQPF
jgi:hypothetical protein